MKKIYVMYDSRCGLCSRARAWMIEQPAHLAIEFIAAGSERARKLFPDLRHELIPSELVVVSDEGDVFFADAAWIVCFYALSDYRAWSYRLARPPMRRLARRAWEAFSKNRQQISHMLSLKSDVELARELDRRPEPACDVNCEAT